MTTATAIVATVWALVSMVVGMLIVSLPGLIVIQTVRIAGGHEVFLSASPPLPSPHVDEFVRSRVCSADCQTDEGVSSRRARYAVGAHMPSAEWGAWRL
jgi:hypothetical protein